MTKKTIKYMAGLLAVALWMTPAAAQQQAEKAKGAVEDARISFIQMTNLRPLGEEFENVDYIMWSKDGKSLLVDRRYTDKWTDAWGREKAARTSPARSRPMDSSAIFGTTTRELANTRR